MQKLQANVDFAGGEDISSRNVVAVGLISNSENLLLMQNSHHPHHQQNSTSKSGRVTQNKPNTLHYEQIHDI